MRRRSFVLALCGIALVVGPALAAAAAQPDRPARTLPAAGPDQKRSLPRSGVNRRLRQAMRSVGGQSGAYVWDIEAPDRRTLFSWNGGAARVPASNQKLLTTAAALRRFGPAGRLTTAAYARGRRWGSAERVLKGDLVIVGGGDPALGTRRFGRTHGVPVTPIGRLARNVVRAGIGRVTGRVLADDSVFDRRRGVAASGWRAGPYLSPLSGLSFNSGVDGDHYARNPELEAARRLERSLRGRGVVVRKGVGRADLRRDRLERGPLATVRSPRMSVLISRTNKPSDNFFAEMLLKGIGARPDKRGTTVRGARRVEAFAASVGARAKVADGSGLGRSNRVSPRQLVRVLVEMQEPGMHGSAFRGSLPLAGHEGTVAERMDGSAADGRCRTKTGTLSDVSALSGYCKAGRGHLIAFSILMNDVASVFSARVAQDRMAAAIASYGR